MSEMTSDPIRLLDDPSLSEALRADLGCATDVELHGLDLAGGLTSLKVALAAEAITTGVVAPVAVSTMSLGTKAAIGGLVVAAAIGAWIGLQPSDPAPASPAMVAIDRAPAPIVAAPAAVTPPRLAPTPVADVVPAVVPDEEPIEPIEPVVIDEAVPEADPKTARKPKAKAAPLSAADAMAEASLVSRAQKALDGSPSTALSLANEAKRDFPRGMLVEEREAVAIAALAQLGKTEQAKRRGQAFLRAYGRGPHASAVRAAIGE